MRLPALLRAYVSRSSVILNVEAAESPNTLWRSVASSCALRKLGTTCIFPQTVGLRREATSDEVAATLVNTSEVATLAA